MEEVEVAAPNEEPSIFPCRCWLAEDEGDGKSSRVLQPGETVQPPYDSKYAFNNDTRTFARSRTTNEDWLNSFAAFTVSSIRGYSFCQLFFVTSGFRKSRTDR